ncbi:Chromosome partition protein Smc [Stieleria neptunia]|uniref:Chromosome partition protein Smc n=1 Tax=Stieleria neptunia TaxID=2527979 RepID=A0A518HMZ9_9BACT|nr:hypothetical protein [Stieleria neptunia]QDV42232.1 Chromosome partition protein Smc [Stieleria neptunia]
MRKLMSLVGCLSLVLLFTGWSWEELSEYYQATREEIREASSESIPTEIELNRLQLLIQKLDTQAKEHKRVVARAKVDLEDAETLFADSQCKCRTLKQTIVHMRDQLPMFVSTGSGCGGTVDPAFKSRLEHLISAYKTHSGTMEAREKAVTAHREAVTDLVNRFDRWSLQRDTLKQQLDSLRARQAATQIAVVDKASFDEDDLSRAVELESKLDRRIRIEEQVDAEFETWSNDVIAEGPDLASIEIQIQSILVD